MNKAQEKQKFFLVESMATTFVGADIAAPSSATIIKANRAQANIAFAKMTHKKCA